MPFGLDDVQDFVNERVTHADGRVDPHVPPFVVAVHELVLVFDELFGDPAFADLR